MLDHANAAVCPLPDNATKLKMEQIHVTFEVGAGGIWTDKSDASKHFRKGMEGCDRGYRTARGIPYMATAQETHIRD